MYTHMGGVPPWSIIIELPGAVIFWLLFDRKRNSFIGELKLEKNKIWHAAIGTTLWLSLMFFAVLHYATNG